MKAKKKEIGRLGKLRFIVFGISFSLVILLQEITYSQSMARVYYNLDTLCANGMHGRGAAFNGEKMAATFIENYFKKLRLSPVTQDSTYLQNFNYDINTFEEKIQFYSSKKKYVIGKDFILQPSSGPARGRFKVIYIDSSALNKQSIVSVFKKNLLKTALLVHKKNVSQLSKLLSSVQKSFDNVGCIIEIENNKLTAGLAPEISNTARIQVLPEFLELLPSTVYLNVQPKLKLNYPTQNIVGLIKGKYPSDSTIYITAHYDHLGRMGEAIFPGANDNASGVSMMIELMSFYSRSENMPNHNLVFIAFGAEEAGLIGSRYYTEHPCTALSKIKFLINLDLLATGDEGMMVVNGAIHSKEFELLRKINQENRYLKEIKKRGRAANSDHYWFSEKGVPAFFFYTLGGVTHYHDIYDVPQTLPLTKFKEVYSLLTKFINFL